MGGTARAHKYLHNLSSRPAQRILEIRSGRELFRFWRLVLKDFSNSLMDTPRELISPQQSQVLVLALAFLCALVGAYVGWKRGGKRAALFAGALGLLIWPLWKAHEWATRFDPASGYFGLESVWLLLGEAALAIALGALIGRVWHHLTGQSRGENPQVLEGSGQARKDFGPGEN